MSGPETLFTVFTAPEACRRNPALMGKIFEDGRVQIEGMKSIHYGLDIEDDSKAYSFTTWTTPDDYSRFDSSPTRDDVCAPLMETFVGLPEIHEMNFKPDVTIALDMPMTEIAIVTTVSAEAKQELLSLLAEACMHANGVMAYGAVEQSIYKDLVVIVRGWQSVEEHNESLKSLEVQATMKAWGQLGTKVSGRAKFTRTNNEYICA